MTKQSWRICIQSYARHHPNFAIEDQPQRVFTSKIARKVQYRAVKTACHEIAHVLSIRHCQAYECLMNGSSQLEEADLKPFALCPVCLRKMSSYLGFNGQELDLFIEMRDVFKLMNHNDKQQSFKREIRLFDKVIVRLQELYSNNGNLPKVEYSRSRMDLSENEGGNNEMQQRLEEEERKRQLELEVQTIQKNQEKVSESSSDITQKAVSDIASGNQISVNELQRRNREASGRKPGMMSNFCRFIGNLFSCFQANEDDRLDYRTRGAPKSKKKEPNIEMGVQFGLERGQHAGAEKQLNEGQIYQIDSTHGVSKVQHRKQSKK